MGNKQAMIGIVVPVYKVRKDFLDECVQSLLNQTFRDIQIVLVDDGSPDDCGLWCDEYAQKDDRVLVIHHEKNKGLPSARNTGTSAVDAKWLMYVDSDDWLELDCCEKLISYIEKWTRAPDMIIFSGYRNFFEWERKSTAVFDNETWFTGKEKIEQLQMRSLTFTHRSYPAGAMNLDGAWCRLISLEYIKRAHLHFENIPYREDGLYFLYSTQQANSVVYLSDTFYHYRSTDGGMVVSYRAKSDEEQLQYLSEVWKFIDLFHKTDSFIENVYYGTQLSMHACIYQKFYSKKNPDGFFKRYHDCRNYFKQEPYATAIRRIKPGLLKKNFKFCAILIKLRLYPLMPMVRGIRNGAKKRKSY